MVYLRWFCLLCFTGCAIGNQQNPGMKEVYEQGYRDASQVQMDSIAARFNGGDFPYFYWNQPVVQDVSVPAHISNGVFIPAHQELVMIKPGEWKKSPAYPIEHQENQHVQQHHYSNSSTDITSMPGQSITKQ